MADNNANTEEVAVATAVPADVEEAQTASVLSASAPAEMGQEINSIQKAKSNHIKTLIFSLLSVFSLIFLLCYPLYYLPLYYVSPYYFQIEIVPMVLAPLFFGVFYMVYLFEAVICVCDEYQKSGWGSSTCRYVSNILSDQKAEHFIASLLASAPVLVMRVECYHMETRTRTVYENDDSYTHTYQERVVTHRATDHIRYNYWMDTSTRVTGLQSVKLLRMKLEKTLEYADEATYAEFERQRLYFRATNNRDIEQDYFEEMRIPEFTTRVLTALHGVVPKCVNKICYIASSIFCGSYFYRIWLDKLCHKTEIGIRKRVSIQTFQSPLVLNFEQDGNLNMFLGVTYQNLYGQQHPEQNIAQAAAECPVAVKLPMAQVYVPQGEGVAELSATQLRKSEGELADESKNPMVQVYVPEGEGAAKLNAHQLRKYPCEIQKSAYMLVQESKQ